MSKSSNLRSTTENILKNAPLKEVIFEINWAVDIFPDLRMSIDTGYEDAVLSFANNCKDDFGHIQILKPEFIPSSAYIHRATHRFHKKINLHPLYQLGPGVFTVNDNNKNYRWSEFKLMITEGIECLKRSYDKELIITSVQLRYIDRVSPFIFDVNENKYEFLSKYLNVHTDKLSFIKEPLKHSQIIQQFELEDNNLLNLIITSGVEKQTLEEIIEWHTSVHSKEMNWNHLDEWIDNAHRTCSEVFKKMISDELYEYFRQ